jgi:hypothetical protein
VSLTEFSLIGYWVDVGGPTESPPPWHEAGRLPGTAIQKNCMSTAIRLVGSKTTARQIPKFCGRLRTSKRKVLKPLRLQVQAMIDENGDVEYSF